ncbi:MULTISPECIES: HsdR family type I site-specific deoxyribonuclease [unclassified Pseudarthrobacter]|uniref:type I restriction endonuclease subunit R n=2 Tax=Micrococcaceae TaxID=1268 RepID=UPI00249CEE6A|nr:MULTISPECIES: HsdR family type I site-specific deoxyribonuclease [unclassified Pseudarthrobacter]
MIDETFDASELSQSQGPAVQLLEALGFTQLTPAEALKERGGRRSNVLFTGILAAQILKINQFAHKKRQYPFDMADAEEAVRRLAPGLEQVKGPQAASLEVYDRLSLGTTVTKTVDGDSKSYSLRYIDWQNPASNVFHVTTEMRVERTGSSATQRLDVVGYVNGIPFIVMENKRPTEDLDKAGSQLIGYQNSDGIPQLFHYAQLLISANRQEALYATVGTPRKFWASWHDTEDTDADIQPLIAGRAVSEQDRLLYALCRPERLLDLVLRFTVFDAGVRKIARHQQYFAVRRTVERVLTPGHKERRNGGVIWHTQGSGKSLTMVMLGKALVLDPRVTNPRLIIVTDRDDLDKQIRDTFIACELEPVRAKSGKHLGELIRDGAPLITTLINKFDGAASRAGRDESGDIFVLVDESHRSQTGRYGGYGQFHVAMRRVLPNACYLGFTGTPLLKRERNTAETFGGIIHSYTIDEAVRDGSVVPILYEGRLVEQQITAGVIDAWFEKISAGLTDEQKRDLKRKFSRAGVLGKTAQAIRAKAFDVSEHFRQNWQDSGFKAQLVAPNKAAAIRFKQELDEIGHVTSEVIISPPDDAEDREEVDADSREIVQRFWKTQMDRYGTEANYNEQLIKQFKGSGGPEIIIVVSKLLTGFDAPRNTVLYLCKPLREHTLLQAVARVNRLFSDEKSEKQFGYVVDYEGLLGELDEALTSYSALGDFDSEEIAGAVVDIREQIRLLPGRWSHVWDLFNAVARKDDMEALEQHLFDESLRHEFYERLKTFGRTLHLALSSDKLLDVMTQPDVDRYRNDYAQFAELRGAVQNRYQETVDLRDYEPRIRRLLDDHVTALPADTIIEQLNINDPAALQAVVDEEGTTPGSKADRIVSATRKTITERMAEDPAFYARFSELLQQAIDEYRRRRDGERYLLQAKEIAQQLAGGDRGAALPAAVAHDDDAAAMYGALGKSLLDSKLAEFLAVRDDERAETAKTVADMIRERQVVNFWTKPNEQNALATALDDFFYDFGERRGIQMRQPVVDSLTRAVMQVAKARFKK